MKLPNKWSEITLKQYQEVIEVSLVDMDDLDKSVKILSVLSGVSEDEITNMPLTSIKECVKWIRFIYTIPEKTKVLPKVKIGGKRYRINLELNKLSGGEYIDLIGYTKEKETINSNLHYIFSIFMHEINVFGKLKKSNYTKNAKGDYCQKLDVRNNTAEFIKDKITMDVVFNLSGFFLNLYEGLMKATLDYSITELNKMNKEIIKEMDSLITGDGL